MTQIAPLRLVQITDCHLFADAHCEGHGGINPYRSLSLVLEKAAALKPDLVLLTGDISNDLSRQSYLNLQALWSLSGIRAPLNIVPGNHDQPAMLREMFARQMGWLNEPVSRGNWCLHGLDSHYQGTLGRVGEPQLSRLERNVMARADRFHLVAVHHHPRPSDSWLDNHPWTNSQDFIDLLARQPAIKLVVHGHIHADMHWQTGQADILACPSSCWQWQQCEYFSLADEAPGLRLLELMPDGTHKTHVERIAADFA